MTDVAIAELVAHLVEPNDIECFDVMGATVEYITPPREGELCVMRGTIPPGVSVPLHSHADPETFLMVSGAIEGLSHSANGFEWIPIRSGDIFHVPGGAKHAFRNRTEAPAGMVILSTDKIGRFFQEVGSPVLPGSQSAPSTAAVVERFLEASARYGYWNAAPDENERVGIPLQMA